VFPLDGGDLKRPREGKSPTQNKKGIRIQIKLAQGLDFIYMQA
jgi:hypothetical protein